MITIEWERCTGCGACLEACPHGALFLVEDKAMVDEALCQDCQACLAVCPTGAIALATAAEAEAEPAGLPARRPEPAVIQVQPPPTRTPLRSLVWPALGLALDWAGRELVPRLADVLLSRLERQPASQPLAASRRSSATQLTTVEGRGRQHRQRRRGGRRAGSSGHSGR